MSDQDYYKSVLANLQGPVSDGTALNEPRPVGELAPGTINTRNERPIVMHPDGSYSTLYSTSSQDNKGHEVVYPQVANGHMMTPEQARAYAIKTKEHMGIFDTPEHADMAAQAAHLAGAKVSDPQAAILRQRMAQGDTAGITIEPVPGATQQDVQGAQGTATVHDPRFGPGAANPQSEYYVPPSGIDPVKMMNENNEQMKGLAETRQEHVDDQANAMSDAEKFTTEGAQQKANVMGDYADNLATSRATEQHAQDLYDQDAQKLAKEKQAVADEMSDFYQKQPKDLWGRAGVNKVSGIIGLFMGALSRDGHNPAMDALNTLVEQNLSQQKFNYEMLGNKAKMNDSLYAKLRDRLGDTKSAELTFRQVANQEALARMEAINANTISKTGKANLAAGIAELKQKQDDINIQIQEHSYAQAAQAAQLGLAERGQNLSHAEHSETLNQQRQSQETTLNGYVFPPDVHPDKALLQKLQEKQAGIGEVRTNIDMLKRIYSLPYTLDRAQEAARIQEDLTTSIIHAKGLSPRVSGAEGKKVEAIIGPINQSWSGKAGHYFASKAASRQLDSFKDQQNRVFYGAVETLGGIPIKGHPFFANGTSDSTKKDNEEYQNIPSRGELAEQKNKPATPQLPQFNE